MYTTKSVKEMIATEPYIRSKYRARKYDGWEVVHIAYVDGSKNRWYYLRKQYTSDKGRKFYKTMTLANKAMSDLYHGKRTIDELIQSKTYQCHVRHSNILQNTIMAKFNPETQTNG